MTWIPDMEQVLQEPMLHWALRTFLAVMFAAAAIGKLTGLEEFYGSSATSACCRTRSAALWRWRCRWWNWQWRRDY